MLYLPLRLWDAFVCYIFLVNEETRLLVRNMSPTDKQSSNRSMVKNIFYVDLNIFS